jgi:ribose transport system substrate-binding protein
MKIHFRLVALGILALVGGCSDRSGGGAGVSEVPSKDAPAANEQGTKPRIALVMKSLANEFFSTMAKGAEQHQAANPGQYELVSSGIKDERDLGRQVALVEEMVASGVDAIVIAPADSKALVPVLRRAVDAGVVVVNIDNRLDAEVLAQEKVQIPFVGPDNRAGARRVAEHLASRLSAGDAVAILEGIRTSFNGQQRKLGFDEAIAAAGLKLVDSQSAEWEMSQANTIASSMLTAHPEIKAILACNDSMALGAVAAVKAAGRSGEVMIVGFDNISAVQQAIREGQVLATADQHGDSLAVYGIELALQLLSSPKAEPADRETPVDLITADRLR